MGPKHFPVYLIAAVILVGGCTDSGVNLSGSLTGSDGSPIEVAGVALYPAAGSDLIGHAVANGEGRFALPIDTSGVFRAVFKGLHHSDETVYLWLDGSQRRVTIDVRLDRPKLLDDLSRVAVSGSNNDFERGASAVPLEPLGDGTYGVDLAVDTDSLVFTLVNVASGRARYAPLEAESYDFDDMFRLVGLAIANDGIVRISFDAASVKAGDGRGTFVFSESEGIASRFARSVAPMDRDGSAYRSGVRDLRAANAPDAVVDSFKSSFDWSAFDGALSDALGAARSSREREMLLAFYMYESYDVDSSFADLALDEVPPSSAAWSSFGASAVHAAANHARNEEKGNAYMETVLADHGDDDLKAYLLYYMLMYADFEGEKDRVAPLFDRLATAYPDHIATERASKAYSADRAVQVGKPVPDFRIVSLDDPDVSYSREGLLGTAYMIDFWATWCGPCLSEMANLHESYETYRGRGFTILSLSFDDSVDDVREYRKGEWKMPWLHAFVEGGFESDLAKAFEVSGIPKPVLVDKEGVIVASWFDLREERLGEQLDALLGSEGT
jgi:thiol-disulfide isomerase/thioredoxin